MSKSKKIIAIIVAVLVVLPATAFGYIYIKLNSIYDNDISKNSTEDDNSKDVDSFINLYGVKSTDYITNILLVGTDGRNPSDKGTRSDAMMILTVDKKHNSIKLTSLARDSYVEISGHDKEKLTHAYAYGGIDLLSETIENNLKIDINNYAIVDFFSFMDVVDTLGGVTLDVKDSEIDELGRYTAECYEFDDNINKGNLEIIQSEGTQKLKGYQALAYARIRYNDDAVSRDCRQREIIQSIVSSLKELPVSKYPELVNSVLPYIKTNLRPNDVLSVCANVLAMKSFNIKQMEFPNSGVGGIVDNKGWVYQFDSDECIPVLHKFIFEE